MDSIKSIAIIGTGISGLTAAHLLHPKYDITLFESNDYVGGHTNTIDVKRENNSFSIDTGFIVFNEKTYPNFIKLLNALNVKKQQSNMSFSFSSNRLGLEYSGDTINSLFSQRRNLISPKFYKLLNEIYRFNKKAKLFIQTDNNMTLEEYCKKQKYSKDLYECYINPLASAIWSTPSNEVGNMPAKFIFDFYANHGLLDIQNRPMWYVIKNGSKEYVKKIIEPFSNKIRLNDEVHNIKRTDSSVTITTRNGVASFDAVIMACHSDQALNLLESPSDLEQEILSSIKYTKNTAILHTDISALPRNKRAWASWNYIQNCNNQASLTYYMNKLQSIKSSEDFCVSINNTDIDSRKIIKTIQYAHPLYDQKSVKAKKSLHLINNKNRTFYVGAYWGNGFHEDGVVSSLTALASLGAAL